MRDTNEPDGRGEESSNPWSNLGGPRQKAEPKRVGKAANLYVLQRRFRSKNGSLIALLCVGVFMGVVGVAMLVGFFAISAEEKNGPGSNVVVMLFAVMVCLVVSAFLIMFSVGNIGGELFIYSNGFLVQYLVGTTVCYWNEVDEVWSRCILQTMNGAAMGQSIDLQLQLKEGTRIHIASTFLSMEELANLVIAGAMKAGATHRRMGKYWSEL